MVKRNLSATALLAASLFWIPLNTSAVTLELALVIDGSGSIDTADWDLQIGAYKSIFQNNFYSGAVVPGPFDDVSVAAYVFSGLDLPLQGGGSRLLSVFQWLPWTTIDSDQAASDFGGDFDTLIQPRGTTATADALEIATNGGEIGCPDNVQVTDPDGNVIFTCPGFSTVPGLTNNGIDGEALIIDLSTDGLPSEPTGNGTATQEDFDAAVEIADAARAAGIVVNAIGVGLSTSGGINGIDFLNAVTSGDPQGFFVTADDFDTFQSALNDKLQAEVGEIPIPATLPLFLSGLFGWGYWQRRRKFQS